MSEHVEMCRYVVRRDMLGQESLDNCQRKCQSFLVMTRPLPLFRMSLEDSKPVTYDPIANNTS
jgi:hypothetical protein